MALQKRVTESWRLNGVSQWLSHYIKPLVLPILLAVIPSLYHYSNNVEKLTIMSLYRMLVFNVVFAIVVYLVCLIFTRFQSVRAAIAVSIFLVFFNIYGLVYKYLVQLEVHCDEVLWLKENYKPWQTYGDYLI